MSINNANLHKAKEMKNDEFYTRFEDISAEVRRYKDQLKGKVIYCPCDWDESFKQVVCYEDGTANEKIVKKLKSTKCNFISFLVSHAEDYGIKKIIASGYNPATEKGIRFQDADYTGVDIVITNPPFSQFREFIETMFKHDLKFLVIGSLNAITYKECFGHIKDNEMWLGYAKSISGFNCPDGSVQSTACLWYTNLEVSYRHDKMILTEEYSPEKYPKYDNYDAIEVSKQILIPEDYDGVMGVPIRFLQNYNPDQFEIVDALNRYALLDIQGTNEKVKQAHSHSCNINGKATYFRILIKRKGGVLNANDD